MEWWHEECMQKYHHELNIHLQKKGGVSVIPVIKSIAVRWTRKFGQVAKREFCS